MSVKNLKASFIDTEGAHGRGALCQSKHEHVLLERRKQDCRPNNATDSFYDLGKVLVFSQGSVDFPIRTKLKG